MRFFRKMREGVEEERGRRRKQGGLDGEELEAWCLCFLKGTVSHQREPA